MSREGKSLRLTLLITIMMLGVMFVYVPNDADASQLTIVTTSISPASQNVDVSPGSTGAILFSGTCKAEPYGPAPIVVSLTASMEGGGMAAVSPSSFTLSNTRDTQELSISVVVPILISRQSMIKVRLTGTFQQGVAADSVGPSEAQVIILQYYKFIVFSETPYQEVSPGDAIVFSLRVENLGNGQDTLVTTAENQDELVKAGWTLAPIPKLTLEEKQIRQVSYTIQTPQKWTIWQNKIYMIELRMLSEGAIVEEYPLFVRSKGVYIPGFEPLFTIIILVGMAFVMNYKRKLREP